VQLSYLRATNFRALKEVELDTSDFVCVIGENNAGKSSLLHAIDYFCSGRTISTTDYYDTQESIRIIGHLSDLSEDDLASLGEHRARVQEISIQGCLKLVRVFAPGQKPELRCFKLQPKEERFRDDWVSENVAGKNGNDLVAFAKRTYGTLPKVMAAIAAKGTQKQLKEAIEAHRETLSSTDFQEMEGDLPTGIPTSIANILPEVVYIPAVKDLLADCRTTDSTTFGKILGLLLNVIEPELKSIEDSLAALNKSLNVVSTEDGAESDERFDGIKEVESAIEDNLKENFPLAAVQLRIPPPSTKTILQNAKIEIHDGGGCGTVDTMGDGLKRSVIFSLFKTYAQLASQPGWQKRGSSSKSTSRLLFLFEEPELYLHPKAQRTLFDALGKLSETNQVIVTTHSPAFFSADRTKVFAKIVKVPPINGKPYSVLKTVSLEKDVSAKDALQIICFENCEAAFFSTQVLLVEGDSDLVALKHLSRAIDSSWDFEKCRIAIVRVQGKGNFRRFTDFFGRFGVKPKVLTDLDIVLKDFDKLDIPPGNQIPAMRSALLQRLSALRAEAEQEGPPADSIRGLFRNTTFRGKFQTFLKVANDMTAGIAPTDINLLMIGDLLADSSHSAQLELLRTRPEIQVAKLELLAALRSEGIFVLSKGAIEDYYDPTWPGLGSADKPTKAEIMRHQIDSRDKALALARVVPETNGREENEFLLVFRNIFAPSVAEVATNATRP